KGSSTPARGFGCTISEGTGLGEGRRMGYNSSDAASRVNAFFDWESLGMKIFLDTADVAEIREFAASGLVDGSTTNPSLAAKTGRDYIESLKEICAIVPGAVSGEVLATDYDGMMKEAAVLTKIAKNLDVMVPLTCGG